MTIPRGDVDPFDDILEQPLVTRLAVLQSLFVDLLLDRDAGEPGHVSELVEFVRRRLASAVEIHIQRADDAPFLAVQR